MDGEGYFFTQRPNQVWRADVKLKYSLDLYKLGTEMFAPPHKVKSVARNGTTSLPNMEVKNKPAAKIYGRDRQGLTNEAEEISEWPRETDSLETTVDGDIGITEWSAMAANSQHSPQKSICRPQAWPTTSHCQCLTDADRNTGLSEYLRHVKMLLSRNKSLSAGAGVAAMRYNHNTSGSQFYRQNLTTSASSAVKKKPVGAYYGRGGYQSSFNPAALYSMIPCKNYNRLHKHNTFSDLHNCNRQAMLDNQHRTFSTRNTRVNHRDLPPSIQPETAVCTWLHGKEELREMKSPKQSISRTPIHVECSAETVKPDVEDPGNEEQDDSSAEEEKSTSIFPTSQQNTMQEYIEKYYRPTTRLSAKRTLPVIPEKDPRLVENIINYRHTSTRERETIHKNRYMQLTATDIRRTTALLLKTSMNRNSAKQRQTVPYPETDSTEASKESVLASVGVTLAQLMGPKATSYRTRPKIETVDSASSKTVISENLTQGGARWQIPRYH